MRITNKYDDIIHLPHPVSKRHPQMPMMDRAAQFSPFAALMGHGEAIKETERLTQPRVELDENEKNFLNEKLREIQMNLSEKPRVKIVYYVQDEKKAGGTYVTFEGNVRKIDAYQKKMIFEDGTAVDMKDIVDITNE